MRFTLRQKIESKYGDKRIKEYFALLPVKIDREIRWLEWVKVEQLYTDKYSWVGWENIQFINTGKGFTHKSGDNF